MSHHVLCNVSRASGRLFDYCCTSLQCMAFWVRKKTLEFGLFAAIAMEHIIGELHETHFVQMSVHIRFESRRP